MRQDFTVYMRAFIRAGELAGGVEPLADQLHLPKAQVSRWMSGSDNVPTDAFLKVVDFLIDCDLRHMRDAAKKTP